MVVILPHLSLYGNPKYLSGRHFFMKFSSYSHKNSKRTPDEPGSLQCIKKPRRVSPSQRRNKVKYVFWRDMCVPENSSRPVNVEIVCHRRTIYAMQQAAIPIDVKGFAFFVRLKGPRMNRGPWQDFELKLQESLRGEFQGQVREEGWFLPCHFRSRCLHRRPRCLHPLRVSQEARTRGRCRSSWGRPPGRRFPW